MNGMSTSDHSFLVTNTSDGSMAQTVTAILTMNDTNRLPETRVHVDILLQLRM